MDTNWLGTLGVLALEVGEGHVQRLVAEANANCVHTEASWGLTIRDMGADNCPINAAIAPAIAKSLSAASTRS